MMLIDSLRRPTKGIARLDLGSPTLVNLITGVPGARKSTRLCVGTTLNVPLSHPSGVRTLELTFRSGGSSLMG